jgi:hypothetical protein
LKLGGLSNNKKVPDPVASLLFIFFAQFVDHDLTNTFPKPITGYKIYINSYKFI